MVMGANIGTSVTNTIVSITQVSNKKASKGYTYVDSVLNLKGHSLIWLYIL